MRLLIYLYLVAIVILLGYGVCKDKIQNFISFPEISKQKLYHKLLCETKEVLDDIGIPFFLSSGTCLGAVRERNFIEHHNCLDIGILEKDYDPILISKLQDKGVLLYQIHGTIRTGLNLCFYLSEISEYEQIMVTIFIYYPEISQLCWFSYDKNNQKVSNYVWE